MRAEFTNHDGVEPATIRNSPKAPGGGWTDDRVETLKKLWGEGQSAAQVAKALGGISRSSVIGKIHRLGLNARDGATIPGLKGRAKPRAGANPTTVYRAPPVARATQSGAGLNFGHRSPDVAQPVLKAIPVPDSARPWLERKEGQCKAPVSGEGADMLSCCAPANGPYCDAHHAIFYVKTTKPHELIRSLRRYS